MVEDFNDAEPQRSIELIPNGTSVRVIGVLRPGGANRPGGDDGGFLTQSRSSDSLYLSWEFTVVDGPYARRKFWQNMTVCGGEVNDKGESKGWNITKSSIRAMLNSARDIRPDDESEPARTRRRINSWGDLSPVEFCCKVRVVKAKPDSSFQDSNQIGQVIEPDHKDYAALMACAVIVPAGSLGHGAAPAPTPGWAAGAPSPAAVAKAPAPAAGLPAWAR